MSFTSDVKKELCKIYNKTNYENKSELYGVLLFCKKFTPDEIILTTENEDFSKRFEFLLDKCTKTQIKNDASPTNKKSGSFLNVFSLDKSNSEKIFSLYSHSKNDINLRVNLSALEDISSAVSFLRGVFLSCGYVADPKKEYHLEMSTQFYNISKDLCFVISDIFSKVSDISVKPTVTQRKGSYIVYIKDSEAIADFLGIIGASKAHLEIIQYKIEKDLKNKVNRKMNYEMANINKTAAAAAKQLQAIEKLYNRKKVFNELSEDLKQVAQLRYENPELSLRELGQLFDPPLSRSGVNHRLARIISIADEL